MAGGADDPAGLVHFILRAVLCYTAYLLAPFGLRGATIAGAVTISYLYAIVKIKRPRDAG
ncbi:hypothetical protein [Asaia krungthepensis]|uniref:Uncharacterized protein n=1 Tax=Asaia krungthepensis NRIC 0535 TaxID=1307925 RepID=A0ABQ0Q6F7_9PROT|nr:hypothetical protein [Asaia krungthepensis]GBQ93590.1 hypothetical protein AA0535_2879 [Asaia krungthepensis NRIC 0535]